jgi:hypothetical protein
MRVRQFIGAVAIATIPVVAGAQMNHQQHGAERRDTLRGVVVAIDTMRMSMSHHGDSGSAEHGDHAMHESMMGHGMTPSGGLILKLGQATDTVEIHLGPAWYLKQQNPDGFAVGDRLTVVASRMAHDGKPHSMAYSVTKGDLEIILRDDAGRPRWAQGMMQHQHGDHPKPPASNP